eukprot:UN28807
MQALGIEINKDELKNQFDQIDADHSGGVEFDEFKKLMYLNFEQDDPKNKLKDALLKQEEQERKRTGSTQARVNEAQKRKLEMRKIRRLHGVTKNE